MTTDWTALRMILKLRPCHFTENMKDCFIFDNPYGQSVKDLMLIFNESCDEIMTRFDRGTAKYKFMKKKGGCYSNDKGDC